MTFDERRERALELMASTGSLPIRYATPLHRLLWRLGIEVAPPHFGGAWPATLQMALFALFYARQFSRMLDVPWIVAAAGLAMLFSIGVSSSYASEAEALGLPTWEELDEPEIRLRPGSILKLDRPSGTP